MSDKGLLEYIRCIFIQMYHIILYNEIYAVKRHV